MSVESHENIPLPPHVTFSFTSPSAVLADTLGTSYALVEYHSSRSIRYDDGVGTRKRILFVDIPAHQSLSTIHYRHILFGNILWLVIHSYIVFYTHLHINNIPIWFSFTIIEHFVVLIVFLWNFFVKNYNNCLYFVYDNRLQWYYNAPPSIYKIKVVIV